MFERVGRDKNLTYFLRVKGSPSAVVELVQKTVRQTAEKFLEGEERGIISIDVYKVRFQRPPRRAWLVTVVQSEHTCEVLSHKDESRLSELKRSVTFLTPTGADQGTPRGKGCLFVELSMPFSPFLHPHPPTTSRRRFHTSGSNMICSGKGWPSTVPSLGSGGRRDCLGRP